jgi:hypothetical protein
MNFQHGFTGVSASVSRRPFRTLFFRGDPIRWLETTGYTTSPLPGFFSSILPGSHQFPGKTFEVYGFCRNPDLKPQNGTTPGRIFKPIFR